MYGGALRTQRSGEGGVGEARRRRTGGREGGRISRMGEGRSLVANNTIPSMYIYI